MSANGGTEYPRVECPHCQGAIDLNPLLRQYREEVAEEQRKRFLLGCKCIPWQGHRDDCPMLGAKL